MKEAKKMARDIQAGWDDKTRGRQQEEARPPHPFLGKRLSPSCHWRLKPVCSGRWRVLNQRLHCSVSSCPSAQCSWDHPCCGFIIISFLVILSRTALHWCSRICQPLTCSGSLGQPLVSAFPCGSAGKASACNVGDLGSIPWEDPLEKEMATHSSILAWKIPWTEERDRLQSMESRVRHDCGIN